jgi:ribosomal protein S6
LDTAGKEETIKDTIDKISAEITVGGGKIETVQKMEKRQFARVADKKNTSGFYVNVIFETDPKSLDALKHRLTMQQDVFRVMFSQAPAPKEQKAA